MFKNAYSNNIKKTEFFTEYKNNEKITDESQIIQSSIVEMAKKFGIDAIIQKANETKLNNDLIKNKLYGNDLTKGFTSKEELLNTKKRVSTLFNNIPAKIRKEVFKDSVVNFVNAYTSNDEKALTQLNKIGIVSDTQLQKVKTYNENVRKQQQDLLTKQRFIEELNKVESNLYENFKNTGNIVINNNNVSTKDI